MVKSLRCEIKMSHDEDILNSGRDHVIGLVINKINVWALEQSIFWQRSIVQKLVLKIYFKRNNVY